MQERGFTYMWMLFLVALLALGALKGMEIAATSQRHERETELRFIGRQFRDAIAAYVRASGTNSINGYPVALDDLIEDRRFPNTQRYLRKIFVDPMTGRAEWGLLTVGGRITGVYSLSEAEPLKQGGFEPEEAGFINAKHYKDWVFSYQPQVAPVPPVR